MRAAFCASPFTRLPPLLAVAAGLCGGVGCNRTKPEPAADRPGEPPEKMELAWEERDIPGAAASAPVMIKEGPAPLLYLSEMAATLRVVDRSGEQVLAEAAVGPRTIVRVDPRGGVVFGGRTLWAGPLPGGRRYAIYVLPGGDNVSRTGVSQPVKRGEPGDEVEATPAPQE